MAAKPFDDNGIAHLPQNTVVVLPKPLPTNRSALWTLFWAIGLLMGLVARGIINGPGETDIAHATGGSGAIEPGGVAMAQEQPTMEVNVRAILELPSPTPTTPPVRPTATTDPARLANFCTDAEPGTLCRVPYPPPPTPTPMPSCADMAQLSPGDWCIWPTDSAIVANSSLLASSAYVGDTLP
jgi:hypothetical protein